ncbi:MULTISPECIES: hypothetical protein [unclassified Photobacterium]|uniref:hypothetical protein n=1 Tax=unclassified Photobacterium TaxID=2628852 RepID=UPI001EDFD92C|nr:MULTISPECIES: hypothetical protein [unclassified Photobacterium]MCG3863738.1 hypothetical protein [Photobacterium sp. Ph6]MCG3875268.1 hypothetical protein [Photobacterium sp. Ph5]
MSLIAISRNKIKTIRENIQLCVKNGDVNNVSLLLSELEEELSVFEALYSSYKEI